MSTATDIAALKARCLALEKKDTVIQSAATALAARVAKLEAVKPIDYATQIAALQKEVDALKYIISPTPEGQSPLPAGALNVMDYGAHGDGATDDHPHIQAAVDACFAAGGGVVYMPAGTYYVYDGDDAYYGGTARMKLSITLKTGVTLRGDGVGQTIIRSAGWSGVSAIGAMEATDFGVEHLSITFPVANQSTTNVDGIKLMQCSRGTLDSLYIENCYLGINYIGCSDIASINVDGYYCQTPFMVDMQQEFMTSDNLSFTTCTAHNAANGGIPYGFAIYSDDGGDTVRISNVTLTGCSSHDNAQGGLYSKWTNRLTVVDSFFTNNTGYGFYVVNTKDYWSEGNTATGNSGSNSLPYNGGNSNARVSL
jgi:hypothetical protein